MKKSILVILFTVCITSVSVLAQVSIAPTNLFINDNQRFGTYLVINGSNQTQEISIEFFFGFNQTDSNGNRILVTDASPELEAKHSLADDIQAFPRSFKLVPGQRKIVRLRVNTPNNVEDGTYWARIKTTSAPESTPIEIGADNGVAAQVNMIVEQVTGIFFKKGTVTTGIVVDGIRTNTSEDNPDLLDVFIDYKRTGNSPFLGTISTNLIDSRGETVKSTFSSTTLHFDGTYKQSLLIDDLPNGNYTVEVNFVSQRNDVPGDNLVKMEPVKANATYFKGN